MNEGIERKDLPVFLTLFLPRSDVLAFLVWYCRVVVFFLLFYSTVGELDGWREGSMILWCVPVVVTIIVLIKFLGRLGFDCFVWGRG